VAGGEVFCWGASPSEVYKEHATPQPIEGLTHVTAIALGSGHSCAVHADGTASCWGANFFGQTGTGLDETYFEKPSKVIGLTDVAGIAANGHHTCAWRHDGSVDCWGDNSGGQLGVRNVSKTSTPTRVELPGKVVHVALSSQASCAMTADNRVWCWGHNKMGDIALGQGKEQALTPVDVTSHLNAAQPEIVPEPATPDPVCAQLLAHRGYTLARASCRLRKAELGLYSATVTGPDVPGGSDSRAAAVRDGVIAKDTGLDAFGAHMKALGIYRAKEVTGYEMLSLLDAFHALPRGMNPNSFGPLSSSRSFPEHFPKPGLVMQPFTLTLLLPKASTGGGGLGDSAPMWSAAILHGDAQYRFEWTLKDLGPG